MKFTYKYFSKLLCADVYSDLNSKFYRGRSIYRFLNAQIRMLMPIGQYIILLFWLAGGDKEKQCIFLKRNRSLLKQTNKLKKRSVNQFNAFPLGNNKRIQRKWSRKLNCDLMELVDFAGQTEKQAPKEINKGEKRWLCWYMKLYSCDIIQSKTINDMPLLDRRRL